METMMADSSSLPTDLNRPGVLVIDGSVFMRVMLKSQLKSLNFEVADTAKDCREAINKCQELQPAIVLIDIAIAEVEDFAIIRKLREMTPTPATIVMIPEQPGFPEVVVETVRAGASGYISKPVSPGELSLRLRRIMHARSN